MIFVPREIRVGYQKRTDTYTGKLAYIIYYDHKGVLRKQVSWDGWRHASIEPNTFKNEPTEGFVLNKKAGGYSTGWNHRQTYTRVYDPRGFEFEITIPNLMYVLENANCIKGKGLEGEFVYGWDGTELTLIPVDAPDYKDMVAYADTLFNNTSFKGKDLILGATYNTKQGDTCIYLGRFPYYKDGLEITEKVPNRYFFRYTDQDKTWDKYNIVTGLKDKIISIADEDCAHNYAELMDELEHEHIYSPEDPYQFQFTKMTDGEVEKSGHYCEAWMLYEEMYIPMYLSNYYAYVEITRMGAFDTETQLKYRAIIDTVMKEHTTRGTGGYYNPHRYSGNRWSDIDRMAIHKKYPFHKATPYLKNGKIMGV